MLCPQPESIYHHQLFNFEVGRPAITGIKCPILFPQAVSSSLQQWRVDGGLSQQIATLGYLLIMSHSVCTQDDATLLACCPQGWPIP